MPDITNTSGGININGDASTGGDMVGRDKIVHAAPEPLALNLHQLPPAPDDFVGRAEEQRDLLNLVEGGAVITGLRGMGGIGKTALGLRVAQQLKARYPDAQFFLDLRGAGDNPVSPLEALTHVVRAYYPIERLPDTLEGMQALYRSALDGQRALVFFDNARDARQVMPLLPPASCLLLITSREHFTLPGLKAKDLNVLPPDAARELLLSIADHIGDCADDIARLCGYLPQALRASASLLADEVDRDPCDYVTQLRDERMRLHAIGLDPARNLDMEASLNLSYAALSADEQRVLARLSVFPADFDAAAEEAICEDAGHAHLSRLVKLSLVQYNPHPEPLPERHPEPRLEPHPQPLSYRRGERHSPSPVGDPLKGAGGRGEVKGAARYSLHDLVRLFASAHLPAADRAAALYQHAAYYEQVLRQTRSHYEQGNDSILQGLALFDREWTNIQAGQQWAAATAQDNDQAARLCSAYPDAGVYVLDLRLHPRDRIRWLEEALAAARQLKNRATEGAHLGNLGLAYAALGETRKAIEYHEQAVVIMREIGDRRAEGSIVGNLGLAYADLGETRKAIEFYEQRLVIARDIGDRRGEGNALGNLGLAYAALGETRKAIEFYEQQMVIAREIGDRRGEGNALGNLGLAYAALGETRKAIEYHEQAVVIMREIGDRRAEGSIVGNLGLAYADLGETRKAIEYHEQALVIDREIGDRRGEGADLGNLGLAYAALGETRKAIEYHEQYRDIAREIGDRRGEGNALGSLGLAYAALGETRKAIEFYEQQMVIAREIGDRRGEGNALGNLGLAYAALGETRKAIEYHEQAVVIMREIGDRRAEGSIVGNLGNAYAALGETRKAIEFYEQYRDIAREIGDRRGEGNALGNLGNAYAALGETRKAIEFYEQQHVITQEIGDRRGEGIALWNMALALDELGEREQAIAHAEAALKIREAIEDPRAEKVHQKLAEWKAA